MKDVTNATAYALMIPKLMKAGREVGYAMAVHGSMARDLDLIAVPWTDEAVSAEGLIMHIMAALDGRLRDGGHWKTGPDGTTEKDENGKGIWVRVPGAKPTEKPHGRLAWSVHIGHEGLYLDISVMPRAPRSSPAPTEEKP